MNNTLFLDACKGIATARPPVWLMRQAGRYMASYRRLREHHGLLDMVKNPELACEVTMQPIHAFKMDAAIIFADILTLLEPMGLHLKFKLAKAPSFKTLFAHCETLKTYNLFRRKSRWVLPSKPLH